MRGARCGAMRAMRGARREARAEEVEHDTRSALGALRSALSTLDRYAAELDRDLPARLQEMLEPLVASLVSLYPQHSSANLWLGRAGVVAVARRAFSSRLAALSARSARKRVAHSGSVGRGFGSRNLGARLGR